MIRKRMVEEAGRTIPLEILSATCQLIVIKKLKKLKTVFHLKTASEKEKKAWSIS